MFARLICLLLITAAQLYAQTETVLYSFTGPPSGGQYPFGNLTVDGNSGVLFGMTQYGGADGYGCIFSFEPSSQSFSLLHSFTGSTTDGYEPYGSLLLVNNVLYGLTQLGGADNKGIIFAYDLNNPTAPFSVLHSFTGSASDGAFPYGSLILDGTTLYGMSNGGGAYGMGTIFSFDLSNPTAPFSVLHSFSGSVSDGAFPGGSLILDSNNHLLYGFTQQGGANGSMGTIFSFDLTGNVLNVLYSFNSNPDANLPQFNSPILDINNNTLYGMSAVGGANNLGGLFSFDLTGNTYTLLHSFAGGASDGSSPTGDLILVNNTLYGMTFNGGASNAGTVFSFDPNTPTAPPAVVHSFGPGDGVDPQGSLTDVFGYLYGMTKDGGTGQINNGTIFSFILQAPAPPSNLTGSQNKNNSGLEFELYNVLRWQSSATAVGYYVYRSGVLIATLSALTLQYVDHNQPKGVQTYSVVAFDALGNLSAPVNIPIP